MQFQEGPKNDRENFRKFRGDFGELLDQVQQEDRRGLTSLLQTQLLELGQELLDLLRTELLELLLDRLVELLVNHLHELGLGEQL